MARKRARRNTEELSAVSMISYLFVPASRPDRFEKALATTAHAVIIDLEDAVAEEHKEESLGHLLDALEAGMSRPVHIRINAADTPWFERDLAALAALSHASRRSLGGVVVPKVETAESLSAVFAAVGEAVDLTALIESAVGLARARELSTVPGLCRFAIGAVDLSFDLDAEMRSATIDHAYARLVVLSRLAGLEGVVASPPMEIEDLATVEREARRLRGLGAAGQLAIHPAQLTAIHAGFMPSAEQIAWARRVVAAAGDGAARVDGRMVDKPVRDRAERMLLQASR